MKIEEDRKKDEKRCKGMKRLERKKERGIRERKR